MLSGENPCKFFPLEKFSFFSRFWPTVISLTLSPAELCFKKIDFIF